MCRVPAVQRRGSHRAEAVELEARRARPCGCQPGQGLLPGHGYTSSDVARSLPGGRPRHPARPARPADSHPPALPGRRHRRWFYLKQRAQGMPDWIPTAQSLSPARTRRPRRDVPPRERRCCGPPPSTAPSPSTWPVLERRPSTTPTNCASTSTRSPAPTTTTPPAPLPYCVRVLASSAGWRARPNLRWTGITSSCRSSRALDLHQVRRAAIADGTRDGTADARAETTIKVVEGGGAASHLHRLQPDRPRDHTIASTYSVRPPARPRPPHRCAGTRWASRTRRTSTSDHARALRPNSATMHAGMDGIRAYSLDALLELATKDEHDHGLADLCRARPSIRRCRGNPARYRPSRAKKPRPQGELSCGSLIRTSRVRDHVPSCRAPGVRGSRRRTAPVRAGRPSAAG